MFYGFLENFVQKARFALKNVWSAGFCLKFLNLSLQDLGMENTFWYAGFSPIFCSLQASDFINQVKKVVCRLRHPPWYTPIYIVTFTFTKQFGMMPHLSIGGNLCRVRNILTSNTYKCEGFNGVSSSSSS